MAAASDGQQPQLGLWPLLPVPAQCARLPMEPQACLPCLPEVREPLHKSARALVDWIFEQSPLGSPMPASVASANLHQTLCRPTMPAIYAFEQLFHALKIMPLAWQQNKLDQVSKGICQRQYLGGQTTSTATYGLARRPPFAPCPCLRTRTIVASTMTYSMSG